MKNNGYVLLTDSTTDISQAIADEIDVKVWPMQFEMDGLTYRNFPDEREMNSDDFYNLMRSGKMPKTSQINVVDFCEYFSEYLEKGLDILYISFSSGLSGTYNNSLIAINELKEKYPDRKIVSVDSLAASMGEGLLVYFAAQQKKKGMEIDELAPSLPLVHSGRPAPSQARRQSVRRHRHRRFCSQHKACAAC